MTFTRHGHQIPFSPAEPRDKTLLIARCGGPDLCLKCRDDVFQWMNENDLSRVKNNVLQKESSMQQEFMDKAKAIVFDYASERFEKTEMNVKFELSDVYIVWFAKVLQNWKALVSTGVPDGMYYEVTYDGDLKRAYIDAYKKFDNVVVPDALGDFEETPR